MKTRREFLVHGLGAAALVASPGVVPGLLTRAASALSAERPDRDGILVILQLTGGNDGLNTVIPFRNDRYRESRPTLAIPAGRVLALDDETGLHPAMTGMKGLYDDGRLAIVESVGYPNPDRSHFRSMDVWHTARLEPEGVRDGWLGRAGSAIRSAAPPPRATTTPIALRLDAGPIPLALTARDAPAITVTDLSTFRLHDSASRIVNAIADERPGASDDLLFVQRTAMASCENATRLAKIVGADSSRAGTYPNAPLGRRLRQIALLIGADFGPRIYATSIGGFDTHSDQAPIHARLLGTLSEALSAFHDDLRRRSPSLADRVVVATFSEFGRRVSENGSRGTDHGAAAPMFVCGGRCVAGLHGGAPDLADLREGDVRYRVDFRRVYAGLLETVLGCDATRVLGDRFDPLAIVRSGA